MELGRGEGVEPELALHSRVREPSRSFVVCTAQTERFLTLTNLVCCWKWTTVINLLNPELALM